MDFRFLKQRFYQNFLIMKMILQKIKNIEVIKKKNILIILLATNPTIRKIKNIRETTINKTILKL